MPSPFSCVQLFETLWTVAPPFMRFSRLPHPWDSLGKNTGVGRHFLLQCMKVKSESEVVQLCPTLSDPMDCSLPASSIHGILQAKYWSGVPLPYPTDLWAYAKFLSPASLQLLLLPLLKILPQVFNVSTFPHIPLISL